MLLKKLLRIIVLFTVASSLTLPVSCSCATDEETTSSFIWEVVSDTTTVYILGSVHIAKADLYPLSSAIENVYARSQNVVVEVDVSNVSTSEATALLMEMGMYPTGDNLKNHIPEELYSRLADRLSELDPMGFLLGSMNMFEPWVVAVTIADLDYIELGYDVEYGIEMYFLEKAADDGKTVLELESMEFQLGIFDDFPLQSQIIMLEDAVDNPLTAEMVDGMFNAWSSGSTSEMEKLLFSDIEGYPEYQVINEKLIDERNYMMVDKIEGYLEDDEVYLVIVGAGHLVGYNGIIKLLIDKGYQVRQL